MDYTDEHIQWLMIEKFTGTISDEDNKVFEQLIKTDKNTAAKWGNMQLKMQLAQQQGFNALGDVNKAWSELEPNIQHKPKGGGYARITLFSLAAIILIALGLYFFVIGQEEKIKDTNNSSNFFSSNYNDSNMVLLIDSTATRINKNTSFASNDIHLTDSLLNIIVDNNASEKWCTLYVPACKGYKIQLSDGSNIQLNAKSSIRFPTTFTKDTREVYIQGEAFFNIAKNTKQPFIVHTVNSDVKVLGTQFNVNAYDTSLITTSLLEGSVEAISKTTSLKILPGIQVIYSNQKFGTQSFYANTTLSWREGVYYFENTSLSTLNEILPRWFNTTIVFKNEDLKTQLLTGAIYKDQPLSVFLENIKTTHNISYSIKANTVYLQ